MAKKPSRTIQYDEPPTKLEMVLALFQRQGKSEGVGSVHPISVRIPTIPFTTIQALAEHSGLSVNKTICELVDVALAEIWQGMDEENQEAVSAIRSRIIGQLIDRGALEAPAQAGEGDI